MSVTAAPVSVVSTNLKILNHVSLTRRESEILRDVLVRGDPGDGVAEGVAR